MAPPPPATGTAPTAVPVMDAEFKADAHDRYARLRARGPVQRVRTGAGIDAWVVVDPDVARRALTHPDLRKDETPARGALAAAGFTALDTGIGIGRTMLTCDPPDHTRLRRLVAAAFTRPRVEALRPRVTAIAAELASALDTELAGAVLAGRGPVDLVATYTAPLPIRVISELLGVPDDGRADFRAWTTAALGTPSAEQRAGFVAVNGFLAELITAKRRSPGKDLLSALVAARDDDGGRLTEEELVGTAALLVIAGHDTTVNLLGNAVVALLRHPGQAELLRRRPALLATAVEEFLRYDPPVEYTPMRFASREVELGGVRIRRGDVVLVSLSSVGRADPALPAAARDVLDVTRPAARHLAFGHGIHHCLGAPLARMEARIGLAALLPRLTGLRLAVPVDDLQWVPAGMMRGPRRLPVVPARSAADA